MNRISQLLKEEGVSSENSIKTVLDVGRQAVAGNNFCQVEEKTLFGVFYTL